MPSQKRNFFIYTAASFLQKGISFLLIPLYTAYLNPGEYGILAVCTGTIGFLVVFFTLGLDSAVLRFYYDYQDKPEILKRKIGSLLVAIMIMSISVFTLLIILKIVLGFGSILSIPIFPYFLILISILLFQPTYTLILALFQAIGDGRKYTIYSLGFFLVNISITLLMVVKYRLGAEGVLLAQLISFGIFYFVGLSLIRKYWTLSFDRQLVKEAFSYSLPLIPHTLSGQLAATADRYILTYFSDVQKTGLLQVAYQLSQPMDVLVSSYNRSFMPSFFRKMSANEENNNIREQAVMATLFFSTCALSITFVSREIFSFFVNKNFAAARLIINWQCFAHVATSLYYFYSAILFYNKQLTRKIAITTFSAAALSIALNFLLVKGLGLLGAAMAQFMSQVLLFLLTILISHKHSLVRWAYKEMILIFLFYFLLSFVEPYLPVFSLVVANILFKTGLVAMLFSICLYCYHKWFGLNLKFLQKRKPS